MEAVGDIPEGTRQRRILESARPIGHLLQASYKRGLSANAKSRSRLRREAPVRRRAASGGPHRIRRDATLPWVSTGTRRSLPSRPRLRGEGREAADRRSFAELQPADARCGLPECHYRNGTRSPGRRDRPTGLARSLSGGCRLLLGSSGDLRGALVAGRFTTTSALSENWSPSSGPGPSRSLATGRRFPQERQPKTRCRFKWLACRPMLRGRVRLRSYGAI